MEIFFEKKSHNAEKTERGTIWDFSKSILSKNIKKLGWDPSMKKNFRKSLTEPKKSFGPVEFLK